MSNFKAGDVVERIDHINPRLKWIGVVRRVLDSETVIVEQILFDQLYGTTEWQIKGIDRDAYIDPKNLCLLVRKGIGAVLAEPPNPVTVTPSVTDVQLSEDGPDTVTFDDGQVMKVPHG